MAYHPISPNIQSFLTPQQNAQHSVLSRFAIVRHPFPVMFKPFSSNFPVIVYHFPHEISRCPMIFPIIFASFPAFQSFSSDFPMKCPSFPVLSYRFLLGPFSKPRLLLGPLAEPPSAVSQLLGRSLGTWDMSFMGIYTINVIDVKCGILLEYYGNFIVSFISMSQKIYTVFFKKKLSRVIFPISQEYWEISQNTVGSWEIIWGYKLFELMMMMMMMMKT